MYVKRLALYGLELPRIEGPVNLAKIIIETAREDGLELEDGDVVVVTSKVLLKSKGLLANLKDIRPGVRARLIHKLTGKDPVEAEIVLQNSEKVYAVIPTGFLRDRLSEISKDLEAARKALESVKALMIVRMRNGIIASDAGVDYSNVPPGYAITSNHDFDALAKELREGIKRITGRDVAVVVADTEVFLSNGKVGSIDVAVGSSGIDPLAREFGERDIYGRPKFGGLDIVVDELCAAAALLMKQASEGVPVVIVKGLKYRKSENGVKDVLIAGRRGTVSVLVKILLLNILLKILHIL
ncbi:MAG: F420-dependent oxidoreductase [Thermoprotei archaeon]|nr:MAG: F420-dependent oxidoreductase [Thermoprotei archaeon]